MTSAAAPYAEPIRRYNRIAMTFHWLVAALILINVAWGLRAVGSDKAQAQGLIDTHKSIGLTVLGLVLLRLLWRFGHRPPPLPRSYPRWERSLAHGAHWALYATMLLLPLTGYIHDSAWAEAATHPIRWFGLFQVPRLPVIKTLDPAMKEQVHSGFAAAHLYMTYVLYALVALHLIGVAKHHIIDHEGEIGRMLPRFGGEGAAARDA